MKSMLRALVALSVAGPAVVLGATAAQASVPTTFCNSHAYTYVVKNYSRGSARLPLRCGTTTWGFRHITHRWNAAFDSKIALTISRGEAVRDVQQDGGSAIYALFDNRCNELFRVIYNGGAYRGNGVRPQGIITAYDRTVVTTIADAADATDTANPQVINDQVNNDPGALDAGALEISPTTTTPSTHDQPDVADAAYRTDCPVIQDI
jgi:hypothetical protein